MKTLEQIEIELNEKIQESRNLMEYMKNKAKEEGYDYDVLINEIKELRAQYLKQKYGN